VAAHRKRTAAERIGNDFGWLMAQFVLLSLALVAGPAGGYLKLSVSPPWSRMLNFAAGSLLIVSGLLIANQARVDLGDSLRVAPTPLKNATLIEQGWYSRVRHPMYLAVLVALTGWTIIWMSIPSLLMLVVVASFLRLKSGREEAMLDATYPGYMNYRARVPARFVPRVW
jgi:protein-S-isoprenylcysteine O-methyltransferase Ste14